MKQINKTRKTWFFTIEALQRFAKAFFLLGLDSFYLNDASMKPII